MGEHEKATEMTEFEDHGAPRKLSDLEDAREVLAPSAKSAARTAFMWMAINTLATVGIVFTNKAIFSDPQFKLCQVPFTTMLPLCITMCLNVILPNFSLAFSSVTFYQLARILLTPAVALMNFLMYRATLPRKAILTLIPVCLGVGIVSYYDSLPADNANVKTTSPIGVFFAFSGVLASSLYTVWIGSYHRKLEMNSMQLLFNQAPGAHSSFSMWLMILMSGVFASLINISQFFIIAQTGAVSSTVVGHLKTCTIVALGWIVSGRAIGDKSIIGVFMALGGITMYYMVMTKHNKAKAGQAVK
ncbi:unnamed protein product [Parascedosporium putredinis]|uniref:GDP-mannose transporter n=1 Tax=Parascedosporium putredinis TaxID=1442378 RepID=A0A9P1H9S5_9PEZI|nr:unnamed protein product [Parascedosporium putredinis]CAI8003886.1 unnamed protein product [Parascedosporium putredinis]